jgi:hypothetical protein
LIIYWQWQTQALFLMIYSRRFESHHHGYYVQPTFNSCHIRITCCLFFGFGK